MANKFDLNLTAFEFETDKLEPALLTLYANLGLIVSVKGSIVPCKIVVIRREVCESKKDVERGSLGLYS